MPSTYDPLLRLELQATGENATTWGIKTNTNLELLGQAIAGVTSITMSDADKTLTTANGAVDEARNAVIALTGTLTQTRNVIVPSADKTYTIINSTSGSQSIVVKTASGTGPTIGNGQTAQVYCDGTNVVLVGAPYNISTSTVAANLTGNVTGNVTGAASSNVLKSGDTMTGNLTITKSEPRIFLNKSASGQNNAVHGLTNNSLRWALTLGNTTVESGANGGSHFVVSRFDDSGNFIDEPFVIYRNTGAVDIRNNLNVTAGSIRAQISGAPTTGQIILGSGSARLFYNGSRFDLNAELDVNGSTVAPRPKSGGGVGDFVPIGDTLPSGGTWAYFSIAYNNEFPINHVAGVAAGGTRILFVGTGHAGFAWRIT